MAINTGGFQVSVMPHFTAPDPSLVAFNPSGVAGGALEGLGLARTLEQLKAEREHNEEFAKTHDARVAMAKAESALTVLKLEHANAIRQAEIDSQIAEFKLKKALTPSAEKAGIASNEYNAEKFATDIKNIKPQGELTRLGIADQAAGLKLKEALRPITNDTAEINAKLANETAQFATDVLPEQQRLIGIKLADDLKNAKSDADITRAHTQAQTKLLLAQADDYLAKVKGEGHYEQKDKSLADFAKLQTVEGQLITKEQKLWGSPVLLPNGRQGTLAEYFAATRVPSGEARHGGFLWMNEVARTPEGEQLLKDVAELKKRRAKLSDDISNIDILGTEGPKTNTSNVLTPEQFKSKQASTPEGEEFTFIDVNGVTRKAKGTKGK